MKKIEEVFKEARCEAEKNVRNNELNTIVYMSGTKNKKTKLEKLLKKYIENSKTDYELGVIAEEIHIFEMSAAKILEKSLENYVLI
ncbi:MAG: hypothetical protein J6K15_05165 [Lachnospiraceae bacterium]|nr:hypothetical protein [Lachnospiraceae bacterium]